MKRYLKFIVLILSLGMFLLPKDNLLAKDLVTTCCQSENKSDKHEKETCCSTKDGKHTNSSEHKKQCSNDCCTTCVGCSIHGNILFSKYLNLDEVLYSSPVYTQNSFTYITPILSDGLKEIWQPPKL